MNDIVIDPAKVAALGPQAIGQLGRLANAIIAQQRLGVEFDPTIKVEMGNTVALLVRCVQKEEDSDRDSGN